MKKLIIVQALLLCIGSGEAQGTQGQIKPQVRQILLLQTYIKYLEKGYDIAKKGLTLIGDIKNGDLHLHLDNFNARKAINPAIKKYAAIIDIVSLQFQVISVYKQTSAKINSGLLFNPAEVAYVAEVFAKLLEQCATDINELIALTSAGHYEMKDDERLERIDALHAAMQDKYAFAVNFGQGVQVMSLQKNKIQHEVLTSRLLLNVKNP